MLYYIGRFAPPYGGVTIKNELLYKKILSKISIKKINTGQLKISKIKNIVYFLIVLLKRNNRFVLGVSATWRKLLSAFLYYFNRDSMNKTLLIVMGGEFADIIYKDRSYKKWISNYKQIYVETLSMKYKLEKLDINNVSVYPNCREKPKDEILINKREGKLRCVFFSMIYPEKGVDIILEAAAGLSKIEFDFWGDINTNYKEEFLQTISKLSNCRYRGVFKSNEDNVYQLLNSYDVLLFPTRCKGEGVPGVLIEAKLSGLPAIVSNLAYNAEIVKNATEGIVLKENSNLCLKETIELLDKDRDLLNSLKIGSHKSAGKYYIENYIDIIKKDLEEQE